MYKYMTKKKKFVPEKSVFSFRLFMVSCSIIFTLTYMDSSAAFHLQLAAATVNIHTLPGNHNTKTYFN